MNENLIDLWAKSPENDTSGDLGLLSHLLATLESGSVVRGRIGAIRGTPVWFWRCALLAMLCHDAGKLARLFQRMVRAGGVRDAIWGERHEFLSLGFLPALLEELSEAERRLVALGVATHHRALTPSRSRSSSVDRRSGKVKEALSQTYPRSGGKGLAARIGPIDADDIAQLMSWLADTAAAHGLLAPTEALIIPDPAALVQIAHTELVALIDHQFSAKEGLVAVLAQGAVTMADHLASAHTDLDGRPPLGPDTRVLIEDHLADMNGTLADFQVRAAQHDGHLLLRAPTGGGKTEAALLWAATQVQAITERAGGVPRVNYTLPYLASINAMAIRMGGLFGDEVIGVSHSRAGSFHLSRAVADLNDEEDRDSHRVTAAEKAVSRREATRLFRETLRVGTPYQLLRGALAGAAHSSVLLDSANSVFILDELHAYDAERLGIILAGLRFWESLGGRIGVVSATIPAALVDLLVETLTEPLAVVDAPRGSWRIRHRLHTSTDHLTAPATIDAIRARLDAEQSVLVVANNVADAQALFAKLGPYAAGLYGEGAAALLHSRFRRRDRQAIEERVRERFGTRASRKPGLLIGTQTVEVSLDVDLDVIHTAGAPLDALLQRFGRVNRRGDRDPADVVVHEPDYRPRRGVRGVRFADGVYEEAPTRQTLDILSKEDGALLSEADVVDWLDEIYAGEWGEKWCSQVRLQREDFTSSFLTFGHPFDDRTNLEADYDRFFNGTEAVLARDLDQYQKLLGSARRKAGRLLADDLLIPLPRYASSQVRWDRKAKVSYIEADYDMKIGLGPILDHNVDTP